MSVARLLDKDRLFIATHEERSASSSIARTTEPAPQVFVRGTTDPGIEHLAFLTS